MMDVDHFKRYNDHHGHQAGDTCLQTVAALLRQFVRGPHDLVARFGGEEFIAILPHADMATAHAVAERIRIGIAERRIPHGGAPDVPCVTMSIGVASMHPATARSASPAALIAAADAALYEAKTSGRNRVAGCAEVLPLCSSPPATGAAAPSTLDPAWPEAPQPHAEVRNEDALLARGLRSLRFPGQLEKQFHEDRGPARQRYVRISGLLS